MCVCVCVFSSHSFWTSSSLDVPAGVTQEEGHTGFLIHLLSAVRALSFSREKDSAFPFPRRRTREDYRIPACVGHFAPAPPPPPPEHAILAMF